MGKAQTSVFGPINEFSALSLKYLKGISSFSLNIHVTHCPCTQLCFNHAAFV